MKTYRAAPFEPLTLTDRAGPEWARPLPFYVGIYQGVRNSRDEEIRPKVEDLEKADLDGMPVIPQKTFPAVDFVHDAAEKRIFIRDRASGRAVGVVGRAAMPYVDPEFRGRGYGSLAQFLVEHKYRRVPASSYSPEGLMNRAAVHKHHINAALAKGHTIPDDVLADYTVENGRARLREPYTPERHLALRDRHLRTQHWDGYARLAERMVLETEMNVTAALLENCHHGEQAAYAVARIAVENPQFRLLRTEIFPGVHAYGLLDKAKGRVIDAYGVRPASAYAGDLALRLRRPASELKCVSPRKPWAQEFLAAWSSRTRPETVLPETERAIAEISEFLVNGPTIATPDTGDDADMRP